jgi:hypothetical protein
LQQPAKRVAAKHGQSSDLLNSEVAQPREFAAPRRSLRAAISTHYELIAGRNVTLELGFTRGNHYRPWATVALVCRLAHRGLPDSAADVGYFGL